MNGVPRVNILDKVKIGGLIYDVETVDELKDAEDGQCYLGLHEHSELKIYIVDVPRRLKEQIFLHEVLHAIDVEHETELSESQISRLANGIYALIQDNDIFNTVEYGELRKEGTD